MIRLRQSTLESFRRLSEEEYGPTEDELIEYVKAGEQDGWKPNDKMRAGTAWHAVMADAGPFWDGGCWFKCDGFRFHKDAVATAQHHVGPGLLEVASARRFRVDATDFLLTGTADHLWGLVVQDHKTKVDADIDPESYEDSLQWPVYLLLTDSRCFRYNLFRFKDQGDGELDLREIYSFRLWAYPGMAARVEHWLSRFADWAAAKGLLPYLDPRRGRP